MPFLPPNQQRQSTEGRSTEGSSSDVNVFIKHALNDTVKDINQQHCKILIVCL